MKRKAAPSIDKGETRKLRRSARIAAINPAPKATDSKPQRPSRRPRASPSTEARSRKKSKGKRKLLVKGTKELSSFALEALDKETIHEPLPQALDQWRIDSHHLASEDPPSSSKMSTYDKNLPEELTRRRVYDESFPPKLKDPKNLSAIQDVIFNGNGISTDVIQPSEQDETEYVEFCRIVASVGLNEARIAGWAFNPYFDIRHPLEEEHASGINQRWIDFPEPKIHQKPSPDYFEGLVSEKLPEWVEKHLKNYARPVPGIAFPNFLAELKAEGSMKIGHTQCRLGGACAARGYYELHGLYGNPDDVVLNTALVGTIEFNGEVCVGNIHWVDKPSTDLGELEYHMKRVFCFFTKGLGVKDFIKGRRVARSFRAYFAELRAGHLKRLEGLKSRSHPLHYMKFKIPALVKELEDRKLSTKGSKGDLVKRLEKDDSERNTEALENLIEAVGHAYVNSQGSNPSRSFEDQGTSSQGHSFRSQKRAREADNADEIQSTSAQKRIRESAN